MSALRKLLVFLLIAIQGIVAAQSGYYPPPSSVFFHNDTLTIYPPDSLPGEPVELMGYNIYVDSVFFDNILDINPEDTIDFVFEIPELLPGNHEFCAMAFYNEWISDAACDTGQVIYGFELPFLEDWSSGDFEENHWVSTSGNWVVEDDDGNPAPAAEFRGDPVQTDYEISLESYPVIATGITLGNIWLDYEVRLDAIQSTGEEMLRVQVWNWTQAVWVTVSLYKNDEGSFGWHAAHINLNALAKNNVFKCRFLASGINSNDIQAWLIDNLQIRRFCDGPVTLTLEESENQNILRWDGPGIWYYDWIHWDDGVNAGNSIGTGAAVEFDVASRWTPEQLADQHGTAVYEIAFFPAESQADYSVRVWQGAGPDTLVFDQLITNPVMNAWNYFSPSDPIYIDITKDLWVGYHVNAATGYPAGVDDGPAIDGYGNMMYYDSTWSTLLEINPELDFNWNIACLVGIAPYGQNLYYNLYREINQGGFQFYHKIYNIFYHDTDIDASNYYCYNVTRVQISNADTCESAPTSIVCEIINQTDTYPDHEPTIKVYPNPARDWFVIESMEEVMDVSVYNNYGERVLKSASMARPFVVDVSNLPDGIYFIMGNTAREEFKAKIIIMK